MTNDDRVAALGLSSELRGYELDDNGNRRATGGLAMRGKTPASSTAGDFLHANNGTFRWEMDDERKGTGSFNNIFEAMAGECYAPNARNRDYIDAGRIYGEEMRQGVISLAAWLEREFGIGIFRCTLPHSGGKIAVVTVHPDYVVDEETGETAAEIQRDRDTKTLEGHARATLRRLIQSQGEEVRELLSKDVLKTLEHYDPPTPRREL